MRSDHKSYFVDQFVRLHSRSIWETVHNCETAASHHCIFHWDFPFSNHLLFWQKMPQVCFPSFGHSCKHFWHHLYIMITPKGPHQCLAYVIHFTLMITISQGIPLTFLNMFLHAVWKKKSDKNFLEFDIVCIILTILLGGNAVQIS